MAPRLPKSGSKRSIKERLGGKADNLLHGSVKRLVLYLPINSFLASRSLGSLIRNLMMGLLNFPFLRPYLIVLSIERYIY